MKFWIFMFIFNLLIPTIMIIFGIIFKSRAPKNINYIYGYRTKMSMSGKDAWTFAHNYLGKLWVVLGIIILILSGIGMIFVLGHDKDTIGNVSSAITIVQLVFMIIPVIPTEIALKKNFDKNGNKKL